MILGLLYLDSDCMICESYVFFPELLVDSFLIYLKLISFKLIIAYLIVCYIVVCPPTMIVCYI